MLFSPGRKAAEHGVDEELQDAQASYDASDGKGRSTPTIFCTECRRVHVTTRGAD